MLHRNVDQIAFSQVKRLIIYVMLMFSNFKRLFQEFLDPKIQGYRNIIGLIFLGIILRLAISFFTSHPNDEEVWYIVGVNMLAGQGSPYGTWYFSYPPVWAYVYLPFISVGSLFSNPYLFATRIILGNTMVPVMSPLFNLAVKLPITIGDLLVGLIIYQLISSLKDKQTAKKAFILWFFNPLVLFTGAMVAQFDVFPALTSLLALVFIMHRKHLYAGISLGIATMVKLYPAYFIPFYLIFFFKPDSKTRVEWKQGVLRTVTFFAGLPLTIVVFLIPVLLFDSFRYFYEGIFRAGPRIFTIGGITPFNLIYLFEGGLEWINQSSRPQIINTLLMVLQIIGIALVSFHFCFRSKQVESFRNLLHGHICILAIIFLTILTVNPQYIIWVLPFLILGYGIYGNYKKRLILLSVVACVLGYYWGYPFYSVIVYGNKEIGMMLYNALNLQTNPFGYNIAFYIALLGAITIILLPFPTPRITSLKIHLPKQRKQGENSKGENL